jgi:hypothetical protein
MKDVRLLCAAVALTLALGMPALAGNISTGKTDPPPPPPATAAANDAGNISTGGGEEVAADDSVVGAALSLLGSMLSLF